MNYLLASRRWEKDYGLKGQSVIGKNHYDIFPDLPERRKEIHRRCLAGAEEKCDEELFTRADGTTDWVRWEIRPWKHPDGSIGGIIVFSEVITEQKRLKARIDENQRLVDAIINGTSDAIYVKDPHGRYLLFNTGAAEFVGKNAEEVLGKDDAFLFAPQEAAKIMEMDRQVLADGSVKTYEERVTDGAGKTHIISSTKGPLFDQGGKMMGLFGIARDITEREAAKEAMQVGAERLRLALEATQDGIWDCDLASGTVFMSGAGFRMLGHPGEDALEDLQKHLSRIHPEDLERVTRAVQAAAEGGEAFEVEIRLLCADGSWRWILSRGQVSSRNADGKAMRISGINSDIHARKLAEENLAKRESQLRESQAAARIGNWHWDTRAGTLDWTEQTFRLFDQDPETFVPSMDYFTSRIHPDDLPYRNQAIQAALEMKAPYHAELRMINENGRPWVMEVFGLWERDSQGQPLRISGTAQDLTVRNQQEQTRAELNLALGKVNHFLKESQERLFFTEDSFRLMVESVVDCAIVMLDPEGRVLTWNSGAERLKGYKAEEILGQHFSRFYPQSDVEAGIPQQSLRAASTTGRCELQGWRVRKDGSLFYASVILTAIRDHEGVLRGFAKLTQDLTDRRNVERTLQDARRVAELASLAKSNFLSGMSHELRTPLNAILGFAQLLETSLPPPRPDQQESLGQILKAGWHLLTLVNEILDLSKVESGQMAVAREPVALAEVMEECRSMIEPQAIRRGITVRFPPPALPFVVLADRIRVKQVLINLLSNGIKYNAQNGILELGCFERGTGQVRISIRDTGAGLGPEQLAQLFQPFNRLGQGTGTEEGSGIGLVLVKRLVELMGGIVGVVSTPGLGSEFWFELPVAAMPRPSPDACIQAPEPRLAASGAPVDRVLYVEDNPANLTLVEQLLSRHPGIQLLTATDGPSGIALARTEQPKVILLDIKLPGMTGFEVLERLQTDPATTHIPVIAISANAMASDRMLGLAAGFFNYLTKPIKLDEFMEALLAALGTAR